MWTKDPIRLPIHSAIKFVHSAPAKSPKRWTPTTIKKPASENVTPAEFIFAAIRTSRIDTPLSTIGQLSAALLAASALLYTNRVIRMGLAAYPTGDPGLFGSHELENVKDFLQQSYTGCIAAAFSYLKMQQHGYIWEGHWEELMPPPPKRVKDAAPDFIYFKPGKNALVESKGSRIKLSEGGVDGAIKKGWIKQILPHLMYADEGIAIGAQMPLYTPASIAVAIGTRPFKKPKKPMPPLPGIRLPSSLYLDPNFLVADGRGGLARAREINFARICRLVGLDPRNNSRTLGIKPSIVQFQGRTYLQNDSVPLTYQELFPEIFFIPPLGYVRFLFPEASYMHLSSEFYGRQGRRREGAIEDENEAAASAPTEDAFESGSDNRAGWVRSRDGLVMQYSPQPFGDGS